jgi:hypothetical protein
MRSAQEVVRLRKNFGEGMNGRKIIGSAANEMRFKTPSNSARALTLVE